MYLIALAAMSYAVWTMIQIRRIRRGDEEIEGDQTAEVIEDMMDGKEVPNVPEISVPPTAHAPPEPANQPPPPLPPTGLPEGWTEDQWQHYGHQYVASMGSND
jgi:cytoskeletal protein RodZ